MHILFFLKWSKVWLSSLAAGGSQFLILSISQFQKGPTPMQLVVVSAVAAAVMAATMTFNSTSQRFFLFNMIIYYLTIYDFLDEPSEQSSIPIYLRLSYFII